MNFGNEVGHQIDLNRNLFCDMNVTANLSISNRHKMDEMESISLLDVLSMKDEDKMYAYYPFRQVYLEINGWTLSERLYYKVGMDYSNGGRWIILMLVTIWICDTAAYFIGKAVGKHKLFPRVSPNKTVEGAVAGTVFSFITAYIFHLTYIKSLTLFQCLVIALIVSVMGQIGDLIESVFKRDAGEKDSSNLLPGHGGMLDRFDAPLFVAPLVYLYMVFIVFV